MIIILICIIVSPSDFGTHSTTLTFAECETQHCLSVNIVNDGVQERQEYFVVTLERTPDLDSRITLSPVNEYIYIR